MKCEEVQFLLTDYLDKHLDPSKKSEVDKHLETCEKCLDEMKDFQILLQEMDNQKMEIPENSLHENFYSMLQSEINKQPKFQNDKQLLTKNYSSGIKIIGWQKIAAGIALLIAGGFAGYFINGIQHGRQVEQLTTLNKEVKEVKEALLFNMLKEESASRRIMAVNYAEEIPNPNRDVIVALVKTLNTDKNTNVRMAAAYSLAKFSDNTWVRDSLVQSLGIQTEPLIQIVLMNILTEKKEVKAVKPMQELLRKKSTLPDVKAIAQKNIHVLI